MIMASVELIECSDDEQTIVEAARRQIINAAERIMPASKLLRTMINRQQWDALSLGRMCLYIRCTRQAASKIFAHGGLDLFEIKDLDEMPEWQMPNFRGEMQLGDIERDSFSVRVMELAVKARLLYKDMIRVGISQECAEHVLPGCCEVAFYASASVRDWVQYLNRFKSQPCCLAHAEINDAVRQILKNHFPTVFEAAISDYG